MDMGPKRFPTRSFGSDDEVRVIAGNMIHLLVRPLSC